VHFRYDPEHDDLRASVRGLLADVASDADLRRDIDGDAGWSVAAWRRLCDELEIAGLAVPEELGGSGFGLVELGIVVEEAGRSLLTAPLLASAAATQAVLVAGGPAELTGGLASGERIGTLALREPGTTSSARLRTLAERDGSGWVLTGTKDWVLHGAAADVVVCSAQSPAGPSLFAVETGAPGVVTEAVETVDPTRRVSTLGLAGAPATLLGTEGAAPVDEITDRFTVLVAAELVGIAGRCLDDATRYAGERTQFGRPIGSFQALKHKLASVLMEVEAARAAALYAAYTADRRPAELPTVATIAGVVCGSAALLAAGENVQVHGGIGMTWEHSAHLLLKRATVDRALVTDAGRDLERIAELTGIG
jgi:alkylation response protein AidB-like acyl-CoA dehydrogenase